MSDARVWTRQCSFLPLRRELSNGARRMSNGRLCVHVCTHVHTHGQDTVCARRRDDTHRQRAVRHQARTGPRPVPSLPCSKRGKNGLREEEKMDYALRRTAAPTRRSKGCRTSRGHTRTWARQHAPQMECARRSARYIAMALCRLWPIECARKSARYIAMALCRLWPIECARKSARLASAPMHRSLYTCDLYEIAAYTSA